VSSSSARSVTGTAPAGAAAVLRCEGRRWWTPGALAFGLVPLLPASTAEFPPIPAR